MRERTCLGRTLVLPPAVSVDELMLTGGAAFLFRHEHVRILHDEVTRTLRKSTPYWSVRDTPFHGQAPNRG